MPTPAMVEALGVVGPIVPVISLLPVLLIVFSAVVIAVPRYLLAAGHWLWVRAMPRSLVNRSIPQVSSRVFQGVVTGGFVDEYAFTLPPECKDPSAAVRDFFMQHGARPRPAENAKAGLCFTRGSRLCSYFLGLVLPFRERDFLQEISVGFSSMPAGRTEVRVRYSVRAFYMLRLQPAGLQSEVATMRAALT